jgi:hypothetical protein
MSQKPKNRDIKSVADMLGDSELDSVPELESTAFAPEITTMKQKIQLQAFSVFITRILDNHGNVSIMARKSQLAQSEIDNALYLTKLVGDCYEAMIHKPD